MRNVLLLALLLISCFYGDSALAQTASRITDAQSAKEIIRSAIAYWRDSSSYTEARMQVHRPGWGREMALNVITEGTNESLVRFTEPKKDEGSATLTIGDDMWSYSPKIRKVIKIPPSMKSQSWMGSDFSYQDLSRDDDIVERYKHRILNVSTEDRHRIYSIEAIPLDDAPVVWGREVLRIRDDFIIIEHDFYDQSGALVKQLRTMEIGDLGGKVQATTVRMAKADDPNEWTEVKHLRAIYGIEVPRYVFTLSNLQNPRNFP